jgi:hypothetical protein
MNSQKKHYQSGFGNKLPPLQIHVMIYFEQKFMSYKQAEYFLKYYSDRCWMNDNGSPVRNWKTAACDWIWNTKYNHGSTVVSLTLK